MTTPGHEVPLMDNGGGSPNPNQRPRDDGQLTLGEEVARRADDSVSSELTPEQARVFDHQDDNPQDVMGQVRREARGLTPSQADRAATAAVEKDKFWQNDAERRRLQAEREAELKQQQDQKILDAMRDSFSSEDKAAA